MFDIFAFAMLPDYVGERFWIGLLLGTIISWLFNFTLYPAIGTMIGLGASFALAAPIIAFTIFAIMMSTGRK